MKYMECFHTSLRFSRIHKKKRNSISIKTHKLYFDSSDNKTGSNLLDFSAFESYSSNYVIEC